MATLVDLVGKRKGKGTKGQEFKYQGFRLKPVVTQAEVKNDKGEVTTPEVIAPADIPSLKDILDSLGGDEKKLILAAAIGFNKMAMDKASDPFAGLIPDTYTVEQVKSIRLAAREIMKTLKKDAATAVKMILG